MYTFDLVWIKENSKEIQTYAPNTCYLKWIKIYAVQSLNPGKVN